MHILAMLLLAGQMEMHDHHHGDRLGTVSFATSCAPETQATFTRAVARLHSFWYAQAEKEFREVAAKDPKCGMAWWGVAMSTYHQVWPDKYSPAELQRGIEAAAKAKKIGAKTPREKAYIDAIATFYKDRDARAYEAAMSDLVAKNPDDDEARIFYALSLINHGMSLPKDKTYEWQKKAADILNTLLEKHPDHPGIAHYVIHSFDYPALAPLALNAANAYAKIAPDAPHALHMPSHIYVRLGMWPQTIDSNIASERRARAVARPEVIPFDALHADDYLAYAYLQRGEDDKVRAIVDELRAAKEIDTENFAAYYAFAAVPARYAIERHKWADAAALTVAPNFAWDRFPYAEALTFFAKGMGAARSGDVAAARTAVDRLGVLRQKLLDAKNPYWADQVDVQKRAAEAWIARAEGRNDDAVKAMESAADLEDAMDKSPVTPGAILPAREMLGDLLLELNQPARALAAYERSLKDNPNRLNGLSGAARAAQLAGERTKAIAYAKQFAGL
jgi:hypothetical protein